ncbi:hypothetical protein PVA8_144 [Vibrio phage PVA8]|nr:hypothetical protein [Vibrio phage PC-Liy1]URQ03130.1 hypothetical protein PVA8_144 [Vibrio phage PVA8]WBM58865.1 hypothetical protein vBValMPVA8_143 [Vibrio phage vB_ValM_PVA8]
MNKFDDINDELDCILHRCEIVKRNLRKYCTFAVEMQYRLMINFIGMGYYQQVLPVLDSLNHHPDTSQLDNIEIMQSVKELMKCAGKLDVLHQQDAFHQMKSTALIAEEANIFAAKVGRFLER